jgi:hypothetical protein
MLKNCERGNIIKGNLNCNICTTSLLIPSHCNCTLVYCILCLNSTGMTGTLPVILLLIKTWFWFDDGLLNYLFLISVVAVVVLVIIARNLF